MDNMSDQTAAAGDDPAVADAEAVGNGEEVEAFQIWCPRIIYDQGWFGRSMPAVQVAVGVVYWLLVMAMYAPGRCNTLTLT